MEIKSTAISAGGALKSDPVGITKAVVAFAVIIVVLFLLWKLIRGIGSITEGLGELGGTSEADKTSILGSADYQAAQSWLDPTFGIQQIVKAKYKDASAYQVKKGITDTMLNDTASQIYEAKTGPYLNATEVQSAIASLPTKAAISLMALRFKIVYGSYVGDLKTLITKHFKVSEVKTLNDIINKKPNL